MGIFDFFRTGNKDAQKEKYDDKAADFDAIVNAARKEMAAKGNRYWWSLKANECNVFADSILTLSDKEKAGFILYAVYRIHKYNKDRTTWSSEDKEYARTNIANAFMRHLLKTKLLLDESDISDIVFSFSSYPMNHYTKDILSWPVNLLVNSIERRVKEQGVSDSLKQILNHLKNKLNEHPQYLQKEKVKILAKLDILLFGKDGEAGKIKPTYFPGNDQFGNYANEAIRAFGEKEQQGWFKLMLHAQKASGSKPSKKYLDESKILFKDYGADKFKKIVNEWFVFLAAMKDKSEEHVHQYGERTYTHTVTEFLSTPNMDMIKGFVWTCVHFHDKATVFNIAKLAERAFRKIPGRGPAAASIGNACLYTLANSTGLDGVGHLSRLKLRIKQSSTQALIEKYLQEAAEAQSVSIHEIEDMAVDDYGFQSAKREYDFDGYKAILEITAVGKITFNWFKPDGSPQKTVPAVIKEKYTTRLKKIKDTIRQAELTVSAQRDRLDRMLKSIRVIPGPKFNSFYFEHGLMCFLTKKIIWIVEKEGQKQAVFFLENGWCNNYGEPIDLLINDEATISLWHPVFASVEEIKTWRAFMMNNKIVQPFKQAYREVYLLTDAEINTVSYSNRMAAHILKQHQFNSLAKTRGWKYALMGAFDNGIYNQFASLDLKEYGLRAEYWVNEVNADGAMNDTGIWSYISTDQLRFTDTGTGNVKHLVDIPAIVLSETMRDIDLFVGVASVGNDPNWRDNGGLTVYNDYWQAYSFGDLNELAKTRKSILENLLPRLKIAKVAEIKDKFLVIKGKLRTYKIHIGSTNILMEPNDQYLCIVPDRSKKDTADNVFLPFEGDSGLSVILSKAILLADDDKITDTTITNQIKIKR